jgi:hypothetical protein
VEAGEPAVVCRECLVGVGVGVDALVVTVEMKRPRVVRGCERCCREGEVMMLSIRPTPISIISPSPAAHISPPPVWTSCRAGGAQAGCADIITGNGTSSVCSSTIPTMVSGTMAATMMSRRSRYGGRYRIGSSPINGSRSMHPAIT